MELPEGEKPAFIFPSLKEVDEAVFGRSVTVFHDERPSRFGTAFWVGNGMDYLTYSARP